MKVLLFPRLWRHESCYHRRNILSDFRTLNFFCCLILVFLWQKTTVFLKEKALQRSFYYLNRVVHLNHLERFLSSFIDVFSRKAIGSELFFKKNVPLCGQTWREKSSCLTAGQFAQITTLNETPGARFNTLRVTEQYPIGWFSYWLTSLQN